MCVRGLVATAGRRACPRVRQDRLDVEQVGQTVRVASAVCGEARVDASSVGLDRRQRVIRKPARVRARGSVRPRLRPLVRARVGPGEGAPHTTAARRERRLRCACVHVCMHMCTPRPLARRDGCDAHMHVCVCACVHMCICAYYVCACAHHGRSPAETMTMCLLGSVGRSSGPPGEINLSAHGSSTGKVALPESTDMWKAPSASEEVAFDERAA